MAVSLPFKIVKVLLKALASRKRAAFIEACKNPESAQKKILEKILANSLHPPPYSPVTYNFYEKRKILTMERVRFFETTSGSTGNKKQIPYTKSFLHSFENMFLLWAHDLVFYSDLNLESGKFFMSVSPKIGEVNKDDRKYLSLPVSLLLKPFLASNPNHHAANTGDEFLMKVSKDLIHANDLEIISIWSPTYLLSLMQFMRKHERELQIENKSWKEIWPKLKLISCWTHAQAERPAKLLKEKFSNVMIQPKGLLMTEGAATLPWTEANGCLPLVTEAHFEFQDEDGKIHQLHEIIDGKTYTLIMSQLNGFLRYNTKDLVKVTGFYFKTPLLEFLGRSGQYSDLAGEKFSETGLRDLNVGSNFLIVPDDSHELPCYQFFADFSEFFW
jgi:hypothetical protein